MRKISTSSNSGYVSEVDREKHTTCSKALVGLLLSKPVKKKFHMKAMAATFLKANHK